MAKIIASAIVNVEGFWPGLFAQALQGRIIGDLICNIGSAPAAAGGDAAAAPAAEKKKKKRRQNQEIQDLTMIWDSVCLTKETKCNVHI